MARFELVIFDCDGVVVDSERIVNDLFGAFMRSLGLRLSDAEMNERFSGLTLKECLSIVEESTGRRVPDGALDGYVVERNRVLREEVEPIEGIREVLAALTVPYCIASSGSHDKMQITLGTTGLLSFFEGRIFSAVDVPRGKPAPDVFLLAAERMGAAPARTVVIEDSVNGVLAGRAAGMTVFGFVGLTPAAKLTAAGAVRTFDDMCTLPALLGV
ncbi:MAG TPA: HAD family hydrolase [Gammaproteobacteria bacterium]|nr:HAD family hydrolase [Gammaproteobacteria bacterium]